MQLKWHLSHARGYIELGLLKEAAEELEQIPIAERDRTEVLTVRAIMLQEEGAWIELRVVASKLLGRHPDMPDWWIMTAYATRRAEGLDPAEKILLEAQKRHPHVATIHFNLGCYACQRGNLKEARDHVKIAIELDNHFQSLAQSDPDLDALRKQSMI